MKLDINFKNLSETEKEKLLALIEKASNKPAPYFIPQKREEYWFVAENGEIRHYMYRDYIEDIHAFETGNCFRTEEEAEEARTRIKMQAKWKRLSLEAGEADNPWDGEHKHYFVFWNFKGEILYTDFDNDFISQKIYFPTEESLNDAIAELGEKNVKKYILGVKE